MSLPYIKTDYHIGFICALPLEAQAMISMLDEIHPDLPIDAADPNQYRLGQVRNYNVISCFSSSSMGNVSAATVANNMQRSFPIKFGLMVGIGGRV
jgi:nucleoside phosphorylase